MKILVAGDDRACLRALQADLSARGADVIVARDDADALRALDAARAPALAIFGWTVAGTPGLELCRRVRALAHARSPFVALLTGDSRPDERARGLAAGVDGFLGQPLDGTQLELCVRAASRLLSLREELAAAREQIRAGSSHDALTGLPNRLTVAEALEIELGRSARDGQPVGLLMIDVDHFKRLNHTRGRAAGDAVLIELARRIRAALRPYDVVGRQCGEEFLVVLPGCDVESARGVAEHVRAACTSTPVEFAEAPITLTLSIGVTATDEGGEHSLEELIGAADGALYAAKEAGRDRVVAAPPVAGLPR